jgi:hypothetical protein
MHHPFASLANVSTVWRAPRRHRPGSPFSPNQSMIDVRPGWADRHDRAGPRGERRRLHRLGVRRFFSDPASSLEVLSPSALSGRAALSEAAGLERSRFGVSCIIRPRSADL